MDSQIRVGLKRLTTQRVSSDTVSKIKTINFHLYKSKGIRMSQSDLIEQSIGFAMANEAEFIEYIKTGKNMLEDSTFDTLVKATGKPWFPYSGIVKVD